MKKIKLFCIPHAGGSATIYMKWRKYLSKDIQLEPIELAGRGRRLSEKLYDSLSDAIEDIAEIIKDKISDGSDYMIYGHSMGSILAYEVCCKFLEENIKMPNHLFISGRHCPFIDKKEKGIYAFNDEDFKKEIIELGGTPEEIFTNEELKDIFVPIIRSDYKNIETFNNIHKDTILPVPLTVLNGREDTLTEEEINGWSQLTSREYKRIDFDGGHFFLHEKIEGVTKVINETL